MSKQKAISVVGLGYVGLPLALLASKKGYKVFGIDINEQKIDTLKKGQIPFEDETLAKELPNCQIDFASDFKAIVQSEIIIICVPTPVYENHLPNLEPVRSACNAVAKNLKKGQLVVLESTINPGVSEEVAIPELEKQSGLVCGKDFYYAHCPERINPGDPKWNVENIPRVIGATEQKGLKLAAGFYESILTGTVKQMGSVKEAEACKVVENSFRDINIAFVNELAQSFSKLGIDVVNVIEGASTKPFAFMPHYPGCGVGGHCIPVDPYYLIEYAKKNGFNHDFLSWARRVNNSMPSFTVDTLADGLNQLGRSVKNTRVAVLGISYKSNIDDCRESPSFQIINILKSRGAEVIAFDPYVLDKSSVKTLDEALKKTEAIVIATAHKEFKKLTPKDLKKFGVKLVIDGRNCLDKGSFKESGILYKGIGR